MHLVRCATLTVEDVARTTDIYGRWLGYRTVESGEVSDRLARGWRSPACAGARTAVMQPASGAACYLRFVEQPPHPDYRPLRTFGWAAVELCVTDTDRVADQLADSPFEIIGPPKPLDGMDTIYPMQVRGPDGEIVYLTQIRAQPEGYRLRAATSLVDQVFILVLACRDLEATGAWIERTLGWTKGATFEIDYTMINGSFGLPPGTRHPLATLKHESDVFLEIDTYPARATPRRRHEDWLPPGVAMASFAVPELPDADWASAPVAREGVVYGGGRAGLLKGPDGALFEIMELA